MRSCVWHSPCPRHTPHRTPPMSCPPSNSSPFLQHWLPRGFSQIDWSLLRPLLRTTLYLMMPRVVGGYHCLLTNSLSCCLLLSSHSLLCWLALHGTKSHCMSSQNKAPCSKGSVEQILRDITHYSKGLRHSALGALVNPTLAQY